jgi:membrane protein YqaA with SNARE-associated domain
MSQAVFTDDPDQDEFEPETGPFAAVYRRAAKGGGAILFFAAFAENVGVPFPSDLVLATFCVGAPSKTKRFVGFALLGALLGSATTFYLAGPAWEAIHAFANANLSAFGYHEAGLKALNEEHAVQGWWSSLFGALRPFGAHRHVLTAGIFTKSDGFLPYAAATAVGQGFRFLCVAGFSAFFAELIGPSTRRRAGTWTCVYAVLWATAVAASWFSA